MTRKANPHGEAARAIRDVASRAAQHHARHLEYAEVTNANPLRVQLDTGLLLDDEDLVLGASVRAFDKRQGIKRGDTLIVAQMRNDDWLAVEVVSDAEVT